MSDIEKLIAAVLQAPTAVRLFLLNALTAAAPEPRYRPQDTVSLKKKRGRMTQQLCEHCGKPIPQPRIEGARLHNRPVRYCSPACKTAAWKRRQKERTS